MQRAPKVPTDARPCSPSRSPPRRGLSGTEAELHIYPCQEPERPDAKTTTGLARHGDVAPSLTSLAARSPASTAPSM